MPIRRESVDKLLLDRGVTPAVIAEAQAQAICMQHPDFREAYDAWVAQRPPRFEGLEGEG